MTDSSWDVQSGIFRWVAASGVDFSGIFIFSDAEGTRVSIVVGIWSSFNRKYGDR